MLGIAAIAVDNKLAFLDSVADWVEDWSLCLTFTFTKQTSHVLVTILRTTSRLIADLLTESYYQFVLTSRFQSDLIRGTSHGFCLPSPLIIMGRLNLEIRQNFVGTKCFLAFVGDKPLWGELKLYGESNIYYYSFIISFL